MEIERIELERLIGHPQNANVMGKEGLKKLRRHIERTGRYEPLVVRKHPERKGCYEILNGHHRKKVLEEIGKKEAECVVWEVTDEEAIMLLMTLNRLNGEDDPVKRGELAELLLKKHPEKELLRWLPEKRRQLQKLVQVRKEIKPVAKERIDELPQAMSFFVTKNEKEIIEKGLKRVAKIQEGKAEKGGRGKLLAEMAGIVLEDKG